MGNTELNFNDLDDQEDSEFSVGVCSASLIKAFQRRLIELESILSKQLPMEEKQAREEEFKLIKGTLDKY